MNTTTTTYRGYTIEEDNGYWGGYFYYPTAAGFDAEWDGDGWKSNGGHSGDIEGAMDMIDLKLDGHWQYVVQFTNGVKQEFEFISDAIKSIMHGEGELLVNIDNI